MRTIYMTLSSIRVLPSSNDVRFEFAAWQIYDKPLSITARIGLNQLRDLFFR